MKITRLLSLITLSVTLATVSPALFGFSVAALPEEHDQVRESITHINHQISSIKRLKYYYQSKSLRYRNRATRLRYQDMNGGEQESENLVRQADDYDQVVKKLNVELVRLERQKVGLEKKLD